MADAFHVECGVLAVRRWIAGRLSMIASAKLGKDRKI